MREIEFRGKSKNSGRWVYGDLVTNKYQSRQGIHIYEKSNSVNCKSGYQFVRVDKKTLGQYTGLKDKNGTKIFEGDILTDNCCARKCRFHIQGYVAFDEHWGYVLKMNTEDDGDTNWRFDAEKTLEVIGNIHDNKLEEFYE